MEGYFGLTRKDLEIRNEARKGDGMEAQLALAGAIAHMETVASELESPEGESYRKAEQILGDLYNLQSDLMREGKGE